jgi:hypothetical protein
MIKPEDLIGTWKSDVGSPYGRVAMSFDKDGGLKHSIYEHGKEKII